MRIFPTVSKSYPSPVLAKTIGRDLGCRPFRLVEEVQCFNDQQVFFRIRGRLHCPWWRVRTQGSHGRSLRDGREESNKR